MGPVRAGIVERIEKARTTLALSVRTVLKARWHQYTECTARASRMLLAAVCMWHKVDGANQW